MRALRRTLLLVGILALSSAASREATAGQVSERSALGSTV